MPSNAITSTKALSPDCGMVAGVLRAVRPVEGGSILADFEYTCPHCGCPEARATVALPGILAPELQLFRGQACRICRDGERYIMRGGADE